jgi:hypothetical protein
VLAQLGFVPELGRRCSVGSLVAQMGRCWLSWVFGGSAGEMFLSWVCGGKVTHLTGLDVRFNEDAGSEGI